MSQGPRNRPISAFVVSFAALSLVASVLPLLVRGEGDQSLLPMLDRQTSFVAYSVFLLLFVFFFLPGALRREPGRSLGPWWALAGFALLFSSIPAIVSAYISGVALPQALFVGALVAAACAVVVLLRAALGAAGAPAAFALGCLTLFVIPGLEALCWSTGTKMAVRLEDLSLVAWLRRLAILRQPVDPRPAVAVAVALWVAVLLVAVRGARRARVAGAFALVVPIASILLPAPPAPEVSVKPLLGPLARPGARIPVAIAVRGDGGPVEIALKTESLRVPSDGQPHAVLVTLAAGEAEAEVSAGGARSRVPLPFRWIEPGRLAVGIVGGNAGAALAQELRANLESAEFVEIGLRDLPAVPGALELFDAVVVPHAEWAALPEAQRAMLLGFGALAGSLVVVGGQASRPSGVAPETRAEEPVVRRIESAAGIAGMPLARLDPDAFDPKLKSLFARPDWQALDLTKLVMFMLLYHAGFLAAFLLPLLLDSHKSTAVYIVSVGFVMAIVVGVGWWSVRQIFLRDNQVYTQSLTYVSVPADGALAVARQFRSYASMSGEKRDFPWPPDRDLVDYRDRSAPGRLLDVGTRKLDDVWLDRFHSKLLVREDLVHRAPVALAVEDGGFRLRPAAADAPDPLGLRTAQVTQAVVVEPDGTLRSASVDGSRIAVGGPVDVAATRAVDWMTRPLMGRFRRPAGGRLVVLRLRGTHRLDDTSGFFKTEDLESVLTFEMAP